MITDKEAQYTKLITYTNIDGWRKLLVKCALQSIESANLQVGNKQGWKQQERMEIARKYGNRLVVCYPLWPFFFHNRMIDYCY